MNYQRILVAMGTRPEVIKLAPVVHALARYPEFQVIVCATAQHRQMLDQALDVFALKPDIDLDLMLPNQNIGELTARVLVSMQAVFAKHQPDIVLVQGDTTTTFAVSLAAFYSKIKVGHVEAGLRSWDRYQPFPEEINRVLTTGLSDFHFSPTPRARDNLIKAGVRCADILVTGNTVIDALYYALPQARSLPGIEKLHLDSSKKLLLVTGHRRENFGPGVSSICDALAEIIRARQEIEIVYPVHLNPNVRGPVYEKLGKLPRMHLIEPLPYLPFLWLMDRSYLILTDSGGVQEEGPALGKPVLVMRDITERPEAVEVGAAALVGTERTRILSNVFRLLDTPNYYSQMATAGSPYGDGKAAERIAEFLARRL